jgi:hypothetical protein
MDLPTLLNATVPISILLPSPTKSSFVDTPPMNYTAVIIIVIVAIIFAIMALVATYKLTNSGFQTFLCLLFGFLYMSLAYIYYGLSGYKLCK